MPLNGGKCAFTVPVLLYCNRTDTKVSMSPGGWVVTWLGVGCCVEVSPLSQQGCGAFTTRTDDRNPR